MIAEAAVGLRRQQFSAIELADACLDRIDAIDGKLHSFITLTADLALEQARQGKRSNPEKCNFIAARCTAFPSRSRISTQPKA